MFLPFQIFRPFEIRNCPFQLLEQHIPDLALAPFFLKMFFTDRKVLVENVVSKMLCQKIVCQKILGRKIVFFVEQKFWVEKLYSWSYPFPFPVLGHIFQHFSFFFKFFESFLFDFFFDFFAYLDDRVLGI